MDMRRIQDALSPYVEAITNLSQVLFCRRSRGWATTFCNIISKWFFIAGVRPGKAPFLVICLMRTRVELNRLPAVAATPAEPDRIA